MKTRIEQLEELSVRGYEMKGPVSEISALWDRLNETIREKGSAPKESFGITMGMGDGYFHYLAGIQAEQAQEFPDTTELKIPAGKFIVTKVDGGVEAIPAAFDALMRNPEVTVRKCYGFERYLHADQSEGYMTEVWVPIES